eukprot:scaffold73071_cov105-Phaeocystis_antarctica.AAC.1
MISWTSTTSLVAVVRLRAKISSRPVMRNGRDARACPRHMRAPARSPALCTHSTPPPHFLVLTLHNTHPLFCLLWFYAPA